METLQAANRCSLYVGARFHSLLSKRETADRLFFLEPRNRCLLACKTHQLLLLRAKQTFLLSSLQM